MTSPPANERSPLRVLLIGAGGQFGSRLAERLVREPGVTALLAGRSAKRLARLRRTLGGGAETVTLDRDRLRAEDLRGLGADVVIDAAGPFQESGTAAVEAAIGAGCAYLDLADARGFVGRIGTFDAAARGAGVAVLAGASSTPTLSHAALDHITRGWQRIDAVRVAICPGNRAPLGRSVVRAVLSFVGQTVRVFRDGDWAEAPGWGMKRRVAIPGLGARTVYLCETPDLDLLVERFRPRLAAEFFAGLELAVLNRGLALAGWAVRLGLVRSLTRYAGVLRMTAVPLRPFGSDRGGMIVEAVGQDTEGRPAIVRWSLIAPPGKGPYVPTLAALAMVRRIRDGIPPPPGARPCVGELSLTEFESDFGRLGVTTRVERLTPPRPVFEAALGDGFERLPPVTKALHRPDPGLLLIGEADVDGAETRLGRWIARRLAFPSGGRGLKLRVAIEAAPDGAEHWARVYPMRAMRTVMAGPDPARRTLEERLGRFSFTLRLDAEDDGMTLTPVAARWSGIRLPRAVLPRIAARETADGDRHRFDVSIALPLVGRLVRYRGVLSLVASPPAFYPSLHRR